MKKCTRHILFEWRHVLLLSIVLGSWTFPQPVLGQDDPSQYIHVSKSVKDYDYATKKGTLSLEAFVEGEVTSETQLTPLDMMLVVDNGTEMLNPLASTPRVGYHIHNGIGRNTNVLDGLDVTKPQGYYSCTVTSLLGIPRPVRYYRNKWQYNSAIVGWTDISSFPANIDIYISKYGLLRDASNSLVDMIQSNAQISSLNHRVGVVSYKYNLTKLQQGLTAVTSGSTNIKDKISSLFDGYDDNGVSVGAGAGLSTAGSQFNFNQNTTKVVLVLTGITSDELTTTAAMTAIQNAKALKDQGVKVFVIGTYDSAPTGDLLYYLEGMSSNYPNATSQETLGDRNSSKYYAYANSVDDLTDVFDEIFAILESEVTSGGAKVNMGSGAYLRDVLSEYFSLYPDAEPSDVKLYYSNCINHYAGKTTYDFETTKHALSTASVLLSDSKTVDISGWDFSANWCGYNASTNQTHGNKLIAEIPFYLTDFSASPLTLETNTTDSGAYGKFEGESVYTKKKAFNVPSITFSNLAVKLSGLKAGDSARFDVTGQSGDYHLSLMLHGLDTSGSVTTQDIYRMEPGTYSVTESSWTWKYTADGATSLSQDISVSPVFEFSLQEKESLPMNDEATKRNQMHL